MKKVVIALTILAIWIAMPMGTKEANNASAVYHIQVAIWKAFGSHPDAFYSWRDR